MVSEGYEMMDRFSDMQAMAGNAIGGAGVITAKPQPNLRERLQEANKRASDIAGTLGFLTDAVCTPQPLNCLSAGVNSPEVERSNVTSEMEQLLGQLGMIQRELSRLSSAIVG